MRGLRHSDQQEILVIGLNQGSERHQIFEI